GGGRFEPVGGAMGADFNRPIVARGAAYADFDHDGDLDVLITTNHGPAYLFRNDGGNRNHWLRVRTVGTRSNRDGIGAVVRVASAGGPQWSMVRSGSSYCSQSELIQTFGLGPDVEATDLEIDWPSGAKQKLGRVAANQTVTVVEGKGIVAHEGPAR
ncbi:MAG TPA: ASPIC/UnbV domain-containing protein, partial [Thermoanaerobaculia bacterium]|nr:ASPIC/UnbV domain-containing protein [Thermoanaerobaculia bacterium]